MSLVGNLEDLGLGDILQIVSLSQKSGVLTLERADCRGSICFSNGQIIRAASTMLRLNLGDLLVREGVASLETIKAALLQQRAEGGFRCIGTLLAEDYGVDRERIESMVRRQIEAIVLSFFSWKEGGFSFDLGEQRILGEAALNPLSFMFAKGLNPQWLALEGSKLIDEGTSPLPIDMEAEPVFNWSSLLASDEASPETSPPSLENAPELLIIDDDAQVRQALAAVAHRRGFETTLFAEAEPLFAWCHQRLAEGRKPSVLVDLIMPRSSGEGVLGGLDVVETLRERFPELPVFLMSDHRQAIASHRLQSLGLVQVLDKPKRQELLDSQAVSRFDQLLDAMNQLAEANTDRLQTSVDLAGELLREIGEAGTVLPKETPVTPQGMRLLKSLLHELSHPGPGGEVVLLVLRFASELMSRAMVLGVREGTLVDQGQFGFDLSDYPGGFRLPAERWRGTILGDLLKRPRPVRLGGGEGTEWTLSLGGKRPNDVFIGPLVAEGRVLALLYGDNANDGRPIGDTEPLEIFLSQAGLAMAKAKLERHLRRTADPDD